MFLQDKIADFDVFIDKPMYMNYQNFPLNNSKCDYYTELRHAQELCLLLMYWQDYILITVVNNFVSISLHYVIKTLYMR